MDIDLTQYGFPKDFFMSIRGIEYDDKNEVITIYLYREELFTH